MEEGIAFVFPLSFECLYRVDDIVNDFFTLADGERVNEGVHGFGIGGGMSTGDDERVRFVSVCGAEGNACEVENVESVGVESLVGEGKAD